MESNWLRGDYKDKEVGKGTTPASTEGFAYGCLERLVKVVNVG